MSDALQYSRKDLRHAHPKSAGEPGMLVSKGAASIFTVHSRLATVHMLENTTLQRTRRGAIMTSHLCFPPFQACDIPESLRTLALLVSQCRWLNGTIRFP